jgi:glutathione S-transferase
MPVEPGAAIEVTAYEWVPPMVHGKVKDMRVRWALEEIGLAYRERLFGGAGGEKVPEHFTVQPFGQVPVYREGQLTLFESGAILLHIGEKDERLLPREEAARGRAIAWMFAALNSIEPFMQMLFVVGYLTEGKDWQSEARDLVRPFAEMRLKQLSDALGDRDWLEGRFTLGDLLMIDVLRTQPPADLLAQYPNLLAYIERGTSRPAFKAAMAAHLAVFERYQPAKI